MVSGLPCPPSLPTRNVGVYAARPRWPRLGELDDSNARDVRAATIELRRHARGRGDRERNASVT